MNHPTMKLEKNLIYNSIIKNKMLGINLIREVPNLYCEINKTLLKEIKEDLNNWKNILCSYIKRQQY